MRISKPKGRFNVPRPHPIVDHTQFTDARPTLGSPSASFNPSGAQAAGVLPGGPPRSIQTGPKRALAKGETNRRYQFD